MNNCGRWRMVALASAVAALGSMTSLQAHALALGRISIQSALGEPLRAEVDIADIDAQEAASLKAGVATPEAFRAAGLDYSAALTGLEVRLQRRPDGRSYLRLSSNRAVMEPFVDLILEAKWSSGRITRDYTLLLDPPNLRSASQPAATAPILSRAPAPPDRTSDAAVLPAPPANRAARAFAVKAAPTEAMPAGPRQVRVRAGDNASRIAAQYKPAGVSLEQMLVALLRNNPDAFIDGNVNVIKSGAVLSLPETPSIKAMSPGEATQAIAAQSRDFNTFRQKLAQAAPAAQLANADRQAGGKLQARVEDRAQASQAPDKLTLSKGAVQGKAADDQIAREQQVKDEAARLAELSKNISDLNKSGLAAAVPATVASSSAGSPPASAPGLTSSAPGVPAVSVVPPLATGSADASAAPQSIDTPLPASAELAAASVPAAPVSAPVKPAVVVVAPEPEGSLFDQLMDNTLLLGGGALVLLLAGLGFVRHRNNKKIAQVDSSFLDSRLQPDSFFGASGGRRIDTSEDDASSNAELSSMAYTPSQLETGGDVDPVAEADVYLAYGRDQQAEEILREALLTHPARLAIHTKLLEIYAKRRDSKAFESVALTVFKLTKGRGPEWAHIAQLGRELAPASSLYQTDTAAAAGSTSDSGPDSLAPAFTPTAPLFTQNSNGAPASARAVDLDLDFSLDDAFTPLAAPSSSAAAQPPAGSGASLGKPSAPLNLDDLDLNLDLGLSPDNAPPAISPETHPPVAATSLAAAKAPADAIDFLDDTSLDFTSEPFLPAAAAPEAPITHSGMLEFDLSSLSLDLGPTTQPPSSTSSSLSQSEPDERQEDPLEIKFLLAEEFRILGDAEGARSLAGEVLSKAKGPLKVKVQAFLNTLA